MKRSWWHYVGLLILSAACFAGMYWVDLGDFFSSRAGLQMQVDEPPPALAVEVLSVEPGPVEILAQYAGMFRPLERYTLGFEMAGTIAGLKLNSQGEPLDEGDRVLAGERLAWLDTTILQSQVDESEAQLGQAQADYDQAQALRERGGNAITDAELRRRESDLKTARARFDIAQARLEDAYLSAPASGVIARRIINLGENVNAYEAVLELVVDDPLLLIVGVPSSRVGEMRPGLSVHVKLLQRDVYGRQPDELAGAIRRISPTADDKSGLFEVEIAVANRDARLRPGLIAEALIVVQRMPEGFRLPLAAAITRQGKLQVFYRDAEGRAQVYVPELWVEQGDALILPELPREARELIVRGQHRLVAGSRVEVVAPAGPTDATVLGSTPAPAEASVGEAAPDGAAPDGAAPDGAAAAPAAEASPGS